MLNYFLTLPKYFSGRVVITMEGPDVTFIFQFGLTRDTVSVESSTLTLKTLKEHASDFINSKVSVLNSFVYYELLL